MITPTEMIMMAISKAEIMMNCPFFAGAFFIVLASYELQN
jgi:hypothetical protein